MTTLGVCSPGTYQGFQSGVRVYEPYQFAVNAEISSFCVRNLRSSGVATVKLQVWRNTGSQLELQSQSGSFSAPAGQTSNFSVNMFASAGDYIGLWADCNSGYWCAQSVGAGSHQLWSLNDNHKDETVIALAGGWDDASYFGLSCQYTESIPVPTTDWYAKPGGAGIMNGYNWDNAMSCVHNAMISVVSGGTVHIAFGDYTNYEPDNNQHCPDVPANVLFEDPQGLTASGRAIIPVK